MSAKGSFRAPPVDELQPHFAQYRIEDFAAVGGMGAVYRATQISVDRPVALKILPPEMATEESFQKHFALEAKAMAKLSHRNLVQLYDFGQTDGILWMIQEWVEGRTIFEVMHEEERLSPREAAALVAQACEGLGYAHKQGIVHRDVKPANMMVDNDGILKLMDFGLAGIGGAEGMKTQAGGRFATEEYAAPELWDLAATIDHRVDIFALGVLLYEALTGKRPTGTFRMPSQLRPGLDQRFDEIVVRAMQRERENRYSSCAELLTALRGVVTSPPKVRLQTSRPKTDVLKLKTPPKATPVAGPRPALKETAAVNLVPQARLSPKKSKAPLILVASSLLLVGVLAGGWMVISGGKGKENAAKAETPPVEPVGENARPEVEPVANNPRPDPRPRPRPRPTPDPGPAPAPDPGPRPTPEPVPVPTPPSPTPVAKVLGDLDKKLRVDAAEAFKAYQDSRTELEEKYLAECQREENRGVQAGDLDVVLFWQAEMTSIKAGVAPAADSSAPDRAIALRKAWRSRMKPLEQALQPSQDAYIAQCGDLAKAAGSASAKDDLEERAALAANFQNFVILCAGDAPPFPEKVEQGENAPPDFAKVLPTPLFSSYRTTQKRLAELEAAKNKSAMITVIKTYGRTLGQHEKVLTQQRKIEAAKALRFVKDDMLVRLGLLSDNGPAPGPAGKLERVVLVERGDPSEHCEYDRKNWKRKAKNLVTEGRDSSEGIYPSLRTKASIGKGNFRITAKLTASKLGGTNLELWMGETSLYLDDRSGKVTLSRCGAAVSQVRGSNIGALAQEDGPMDILIVREATALTVTINDKQALQAKIHDRELGAIALYPGSGRLAIEEFVLEATPAPPAEMRILGGSSKNGWSKGMTQLVSTGDNGLTTIFIGQDQKSAVWGRRSRDGGDRWDDVYPIIKADVFNTDIYSLAAAQDPRRDQIYLTVATGKANHRIYLLTGRNGGRTWSKPVEITAMVKKPGWNVSLGGQGIVVQRSTKHQGRIVLPMQAGNEGYGLYMVISDDSGRSWKRVGPLLESYSTGAELMEDEEGVLRSATRPPGGVGGFRMSLSSSDGGATWSKPVVSRMKNAQARGSLTTGLDAAKKPVWYYVTSDVINIEDRGPVRTHLTLYGSRDQGKTWQELRRVPHGGWAYPTVVSLGLNRCGIGFRRESHSASSQQIRFVAVDDLWGK